MPANTMISNKQLVSSIITLERNSEKSHFFFFEGGWLKDVCCLEPRFSCAKSLTFSLLKIFKMISCLVLLPWFLSLALFLSPPPPTFPLIKRSCLGDSPQFFLYKGNVEKRCIFRNFRPWSKLLTNKLLLKKILWLSKES